MYIPIAHAGDDVTYFIGCTATLDGSLSYDLDFADDTEENTLTYKILQLAGFAGEQPEVAQAATVKLSEEVQQEKA